MRVKCVQYGLNIVCYRCSGEHLFFYLYIPVVFILFHVSLLIHAFVC